MSWAVSPTRQDRIDNYPAAAREQNASGHVMLDCEVLPTLAPECVVLNETPSDLGFGAAALSLARLYRASAEVGGRPTPGGRALLNIYFSRSILTPPGSVPASPGFSGAIPVVADRPNPPNLITQPVWLSQPTSAQLTAAYPMDVPTTVGAVDAELECIAGLYGLLHCNGVSVRIGLAASFVPAARSVVQYFRIGELDEGGSPTAGRPIFVAVRLSPP